MSEAVRLTNVTKRFGDLVAVNDLSLAIPRGVCFGILGPNGAGKTTTIRMIQAQSPPNSGTIEVLGEDVVANPRHAKRRVGVVPQENNLDPDFTVRHNLLVYARFFRIPPKDAQAKADALLQFVQLTDKKDAAVPELSGGMKRRLVVARSLVNDPELLVLDEPTTGLDPQARHTIWDKIRGLRHQGKTILLTTHYMDEAEVLCDQLVIMDQGRILEQGSPRDLIAKHTEGHAVEFVVGWSQTGGNVDALAKALQDAKVSHQRLPDRVVAYGAAAVEGAARWQKGFPIQETIVRKATLEDVFLRLTGRALRD